MRDRISAAVLLSLLLFASVIVRGASAAPDAFDLDRENLIFGVLSTGKAVPIVTPPQRVFVVAPGQQGLQWTAAVDRSWLEVQPTSGRIPARLTLSVRPSALDGRGDDDARVIISVNAGGVPLRRTISVRLRLLAERRPPVGALDVPADYAIVTGPTRLFGWALHDVGVSGVAICRDPLPRSQRNDACGEDLAPIGDADVYYSARPDVALVAHTQPHYDRAGWTYALFPRSIPKGGRGTFRIYAVARALDGTRAVIGTRTITVVPAEEPWLTLPPHARAIVALIVLGLAFHILLRWLSGRRLPDVTRASGAPEVQVGRLEIAGIASIVALSLAMNLSKLTGSLTYDELYTASHYVVGVPFWTPALEANTFTNHIAYSLLAAVSVRLLGASEFALRVPATLLGALAIVAVWRYARSFAGTAVALSSALLLAIMPFHTHWSRMARGYTGLALMTMIAVHGFSAVVRNGSKRGAVEHAVGLVLATYFHLYAGFVYLTQYLLFAALAVTSASFGRGWPLTRRSFRLLWVSFLCAGVAILVLYAPVMTGLLTVLPLFAKRAGLRVGLFVDVFNAFAGSESTTFRAGVAAVVALGTAYLWRRSKFDALHLAGLIAIPVSIVVLLIRPRVQLERYFGYWSPAFVLFVAAGIGFLAGWMPGVRRPRTRWVLRAAVATAVFVAIGVNWTQRDREMGPRGGYGANLLPLNDPPGPPVFVVGADAEMFQYYVRQPIVALTSGDDLQYYLAVRPLFRVAYHNVSWNSPEHRRMADILRRSCPVIERGNVAIFECGG